MQNLESAYILHSRYYRDTSLILDLLTKEQGRISVIAKGARKNSKWKGILQLFSPILVAWRGKSELPILTTAEPDAQASSLSGNALLSGFYINELLIRLLEKQDPHPRLFDRYVETLQQLNGDALQQVLRRFEKGLLQCIGYGLSLEHELDTGLPIQSEQWYQYHLEEGAKRLDNKQHALNPQTVYQGKSLLNLQAEQWDDAESLQDAKRLMRQVLAELLHHKPLKSRELFALV